MSFTCGVCTAAPIYATRTYAHTATSDTKEGKSTSIKGHTGPVRTVNFSHDGRWILSGSDDKTVKVWQVSNHKFICALSGHMNWVRSAEFNGNARQVVSGSDDRTVRLWDIESHQCITQFPDVLGEVYSARFHPDNNCIASGSSDHCVQERFIQFAFTQLEITFFLAVRMRLSRFGTCEKDKFCTPCKATTDALDQLSFLLRGNSSHLEVPMNMWCCGGQTSISVVDSQVPKTSE